LWAAIAASRIRLRSLISLISHHLPYGVGYLWHRKRWCDDALFAVLGRCIFLTEPRIELYDAKGSKYHLTLSPTVRGNLSILASKLHDSLPALESLTIVLEDHTDYQFLNYLDPIDSFKDFSKVERLRASHQMLFGADYSKL
jgi:hypothetical protein